jgi:hypothetical protein
VKEIFGDGDLRLHGSSPTVREGAGERMKEEGGRMKGKQMVFTSSFTLPPSAFR